MGGEDDARDAGSRSLAPQDAEGMAAAVRELAATRRAAGRWGGAPRAFVIRHHDRTALAERYLAIPSRLVE